MLQAMDYKGFILNPSIADNLSDLEQAILLMLIRDSLTAIPAASIAWFLSPKDAFLSLKRQFSYSIDLQRDSIYREFHAMNFSTFKGDLTEFNANFTSLLARLSLTKVNIELQDQVNQYLNALEKSFPQWTERIRGTIKTLRAIN